MKTRKLNLRILTAGVLLLAFSFSLVAQPQQRRIHAPSQRGESIHAIPGLTEDQKANMKEIHLSTMKEVQPLKDELNINYAKLKALVKKDNPDMNNIKKIVEANAGLQVKVQMITIESKIKTRSLLSEEQKIIFDAKSERVKRMKAVRNFKQREPRGRQRMGRPGFERMKSI